MGAESAIVYNNRIIKLKRTVKEVERKLELANKVIELQNEQIEKLNKFIDFKETEARLQDNAIDRNNTIIHYLEAKMVDLISQLNKA